MPNDNRKRNKTQGWSSQEYYQANNPDVFFQRVQFDPGLNHYLLGSMRESPGKARTLPHARQFFAANNTLAGEFHRRFDQRGRAILART